MQLLDVSMQESSRGASLEWTAPRGPWFGQGSEQIGRADVKKVFLFGLDDASIGRVVRERSSEMLLERKYKFVVDSPNLPVI